MSTPASIRSWAQRLLALEAANHSAFDVQVPEVVRICEKLRVALTQFIGPDGFTALLRRALALARPDVLSLQTTKVSANGHLEGIEAISADAKDDAAAAVAITAHLLNLLVTFIGEPLTRRLMNDAFSGASDSRIGESEDFNE